MGLRIRTNVASLKAQRSLGGTTQALNSNMERLSSGYRINKSADDAAGLAISETMRSRIRSMGQAKRNAQDGLSMIQVAEGGLTEVSNILVRMRELAMQSASDTIGLVERGYTNREYNQLVDEIDRIANTTEFNGLRLFAGSDGNNELENITLYVGPGSNQIPNSDTIDININEFKLDTKEVLGLNNEAEIGPIDLEEGFERITAQEKLGALDKALNMISSNRATLGSKQSRLNSTISNLEVQTENLEQSRSRIRDVDFAAETAELTQNHILSQAGLSVLSQANSMPQEVIRLLQS